MRSFIIIALVLLAASSSAQNLSVFNLDATGFPTMKASFYAFDANGVQQSPSPSEITVTEDGITRTVTDISCPPKKDPSPITLGIMVDTYSGIDLAKEGAQKLINLLSIPPSEAGITMMDHGAFIVQDLTQKTSKLQTAIAKLQPAPGVDLQTMFYAPNAGGVPFVSGRPNKKVLVLITDLHCPLLNLDKAQLYKDAAKENISVFIILLGTNDEYGYSKEITSKTGGILFEKINSSQQLNKAVSTIITNVDSLLPCDLSWESSPNCDLTRHAIISYANIGIDSIVYAAPDSSRIILDVSPNDIFFGRVVPIVAKDTFITISAKYKPVRIDSIFSTNPKFEVINARPFGYILNKGERKKIDIRFNVLDSSYEHATIKILSTSCIDGIAFLRGGFIYAPQSVKSLRIQKPNGGESFSVNDNTQIVWTGSIGNDPVVISYSTDNGNTWKEIARGNLTSPFEWHVPNTPSTQCLVKILELNSLDTIPLIGHQAIVMCIKFTPDGRKVVTGGKDGLVNVWDAQNGALLFSIKAGTNSIEAVAISPDNQFILSGSLDGLAKIWNLNDGSLVKKFSPGSAIYDANFNYDGSQIITAGENRKLIIWDVQSGSIFKNLTPGNTRYYSADFSPDGQKLVFVGDGVEVYVMDIQSGTVTTYIAHAEHVNYITFSHDGKLIGSASNDNYGLVWKSPTSDVLLQGHYANVESIQFAPNDQTVITAAEDGKALLYDCATGKILNSFMRNNWGVAYASFNPDGTIIATAHYDNMGMLWHFQDFLQSDTSDAVFSIIAPTFSFASNVIDLGQVETFKEKDSVVKATICNSGAVPLHVLGMDVTGGDKKDFMIMSGAGDFTLQPGECRDVMFSFMPMLQGKFSATVTLRTANGNFADTLKILGEGIAPQLAVMGSVIDFGQVAAGSYKDTTIVIAIQNIGKTSVTFSPASQLGPDVKQFIPQSASGFSLAPNATESITLRFAPHFIGRTSGRIAYAYNGPSSPAILNVFGQGLGGLVSIADDSGYAGDHKNIPMVLGKVPVTSVQSEATNFSARIAYDRTVLYYPSSGSVQHGARFDTVTVSGSVGSDSILANLPFVAMLGDSKSSPMNIVDFSWLDGSGNPADFDVETQSATFHMLGICPAGGARLYNPDGQVSMAHITPNPVNGMMHIDIQTTEIGITKLALVNLLGATVTTISDTELKPGVHSFDVNTSSLSAGSYFLMLQTPTVRRMQRVDLEK